MAKKIKLSEYLAQAPVVENLKNFTGIDAANAVGMMTPERLAAVAGGLGVINLGGDIIDINVITKNGQYRGYKWLNTPVDGIAVVRVSAYSPDWISQEFISVSNLSRRYVRCSHAGVWGDWFLVSQTKVVVE